jgi:hypothetical protein
MVAGGIEFDWDEENKKHLAAHKVAPTEFEQLLDNQPLDLAYEVIHSAVPACGPNQSRPGVVGGVDDSQRKNTGHHRFPC